jgi:hypothetical protein
MKWRFRRTEQCTKEKSTIHKNRTKMCFLQQLEKTYFWTYDLEIIHHYSWHNAQMHSRSNFKGGALGA